MKNQKKTEFKVGVTVIVGLIILVWVLGWAKNFSFNSNERNLTIVFNNAAGLSVGDAVAIQGIKSGYVEKMYNQNSQVVVEISLFSDTELFDDATFNVMMVDLMGGKKIEIIPGTSQKPLDFSKIQHGEFSGDIATSMAMLGAVQNDLVDVIYEVKEALGSFNKLVSDSMFIDEIKGSVSKLNKLIEKTDEIVSANGDAFTDLIENSNNLISSSNELINDNKDDIKLSLKNINSLVENTNSLILKIDSFVNEVESKENNLGKVIYNEEIINNLSSSLKELKEISKTINEQLKGKGLKVDAYIF